MVYSAGLAALVAGVPRVVLSMRNQPDFNRAGRWRPDEEPVFRALAQFPGVVVTANAACVATRWEAWLGMPAGSVRVINNGVEPLAETPGEDDQALWDSFDARTPDADMTVGGVMRMHPDKRPLEWLAIAQGFLQKRPNSRFILVGGGMLLDDARSRARELGIAERVLFTGLSASAGFWLTKMDAFLLVSQSEGLPNVLIEAQLAGKPVVATDAGGSRETVIDGVTGWILPDVDDLNVEDAIARLDHIAAVGPVQRAAIGEAARAWARQKFSVEAMLERTVEVFMSAPWGSRG